MNSQTTAALDPETVHFYIVKIKYHIFHDYTTGFKPMMHGCKQGLSNKYMF